MVPPSTPPSITANALSTQGIRARSCSSGPPSPGRAERDRSLEGEEGFPGDRGDLAGLWLLDEEEEVEVVGE